MLDDTIAAIATPLGEGGLAVIRLSGARALHVAEKCFRPAGKSALKLAEAPTHTLHYGHVHRDGHVVDEVLVAVMRAPRTFTREDVVEISCHGGLLVAKLVLDTVLAAGARLAEPGEFTKRAFLNGRLDLAQAEAVADLIHSRTELAVDAANEQLAGKLSQRIRQLRDELMLTLAHIEAHIDFPDEDIAPDTREQLLARLDRGVAFMNELLRTASDGQVLRRGIRAAIVGRPNAGKSSLLNQLLGHERAIVSPIPGTTRDTISETASIRGIPVVFIDTAGLREAGDVIEAEGVRRSRETLARAELVLHVLDASEPWTDEDARFLAEFAGKKRIVVRNKVDLPAKLEMPPEIRREAVSATVRSEGDRSSNFSEPPAQPESLRLRQPRAVGSVTQSAIQDQRGLLVIDVSCITGAGIEELKDAIKSLVWAGEVRADALPVMINSRHENALRRGREAVQHAAEALRADATLELVALDLRIGTNAVGEIVGATTTEDLLDSIFSTFCIGK